MSAQMNTNFVGIDWNEKKFEVGYIKLALLHCSYREFTAMNLSLVDIGTQNRAISLWCMADESSMGRFMKCRDPPRSSRWLQMPRRQICTNKSATMALHYSDVIKGAMAYQITSLTIVYSAVYSGADKKHQSSASLAFVRRIHRWAVDFPHKEQVTRKIFPFDDVIMDTNMTTVGWGLY